MSTFQSQPRGDIRPSALAQKSRKPKCEECEDTVWLVEVETDQGIYTSARECPYCEEFYG